MKIARITESEKPLEIVQVADLKPLGTEVVIRVRSVGVCHSDLHLWEGGYDMGDGQFMKVTDRGVKYPVTPGHEITGTVQEIGPDAHDISKGDLVLVYPWVGCGKCPGCSSRNENLCDALKSIVFRWRQTRGNGSTSTSILQASEVNPDPGNLACSVRNCTAYTFAD